MFRSGVFTIAFTVALATAWASACSSFDDAPASGEDASVDGSADGGTGGDTSVDGATADAQPAPFRCADHDATFCDDFDRGGTVDYSWDNLLSAGNGNVDFTTDAASPPSAARAFIPKGTPIARAQLKKILPMPASRFRFSGVVRLDALPFSTDQGFSHLAVVELDEPPCVTSGGTKQRAVELSVYGTTKVRVVGKGLAPCPADGGVAAFYDELLPFTPAQLANGEFHRFVIELSHDKCPNATEPIALRASIDDKGVCAPVGIDPFTESTSTRSHIGTFIASNTSFDDTAYVYDDILIETE